MALATFFGRNLLCTAKPGCQAKVKTGIFTLFESVGSLPLILNQDLTLGTEIQISGIEKDELESRNRIKLKKQ